MDLVRFASLQTHNPLEELEGAFKWEGIEVTAGTSGETKDGAYLLVVARVPLDGEPNVDTDGFVEVPNEARRAGEQAIEAVADHLSVLAGVRIEIWSPRLPAAFSATEPDALKHLQTSKGLRDFDRFMPADIYRVEFDRAHVKDLDDREEGVSLLAECLAAQRHSSQFRDLIRFFEAAFGTSSNRLVVCLSEFLETWPALEYSKTEVKRWITSMRGPAVHADRGRSAPTEGEFRTVVRRMLFGAHDVLMNKQSWRSRSTDRRDIWRPNLWTTLRGRLGGRGGGERTNRDDDAGSLRRVSDIHGGD